MNKSQETKLINLIIDFLIDADHLYNVEKYSLEAYTNESSTKVPITFKGQEKWLDNITIDYYTQEFLDECCGFNRDEDYIILNCELKDLQKNGYIKYFLNENLTNKLNDEFAKR